MAINKTSGVDEEVFVKCGFPIPYKEMWIIPRPTEFVEGMGTMWAVSTEPENKLTYHLAFTIRAAKQWITKYQNTKP